MKAVILFTLEGCGPCNNLLQQGIVQKLTHECSVNRFSFAHFAFAGGKFRPNEPPTGVKKTQSFPELCFVTYDDKGQITHNKSFMGGSEIQTFSCWLRHRRENDAWRSGWTCPDFF